MAGAWRAAHLPLGLSRSCPRQLASVENVGRAPTLLPVANGASTRVLHQRRGIHYRVGATIPSVSSPRTSGRLFSNTARQCARGNDGASTKPSPLDYLDRENEELDNRARVVNRLPLVQAIGQQVEESLQKQLELARIAIKEDSTIEQLAELAPELNKEELVSYQNFIRSEYKDDAALRAAVKNARQETDKSLRSVQGRLWLTQQEHVIREFRSFGSDFSNVRRDYRSFWQDGEDDSDYWAADDDDDEPKADDMTSMGHAKLEEVREHRQYARVAAWEMPLLSKFAKPFQPPAADEPLRFRYTSYMGEFHPAEKKVVVEFCPEDLYLTEAQQLKLKKLVGVRYNPQKGIVRMSCEQFEHQAQNKRYLGDLVESLIAEAQDATDTFEDIPLDTRHHTWKTKPKFPREWRMSEERQKELHDIRAKAFLLDSGKKQNGTLVDGVESIAAFLAPPAPRERIPGLMRAPAGGSREASPRR